MTVQKSRARQRRQRSSPKLPAVSFKEDWLELGTHSLSSADFLQEEFSRAPYGKSDAPGHGSPPRRVLKRRRRER
jgi:hypothetical protein